MDLILSFRDRRSTVKHSIKNKKCIHIQNEAMNDTLSATLSHHLLSSESNAWVKTLGLVAPSTVQYHAGQCLHTLVKCLEAGRGPTILLVPNSGG